MQTCLVRRLVKVATLVVTLAPPLASAQAQQGTVTGRVTDAASNQPIVAAQVAVVGTNQRAETNTDGRYTLQGISAGQVEVRVLRLGFAELRKGVTVTAGQTATLDFAIAAVAVTLNPIVTTATGQQRRIEVGNAIAQVDAVTLVETKAVSGMGDLLTSRAAGVLVTPGTQTGAGTRIRIRGTSSLSLTNNPIVVIDGIRVESATGSSSVSVGGTTPSRLNDLNPEEFESIEVIRGPSAATLYGTDAANGVIVMTTKKGTAGRPQWSYYTEQTAISDRNEYPTAWWGWRTGTTANTTSSPSNTVQCFLSQVVSGACVQDSVTSYNLVNDKESTPFGIGYRQQQGVQLRGGSEVARYFLHGEWESEDGVTTLPEFEKRYLAANNRSLSSRQLNPGGLSRVTGRSNVNISLPRNAEIQASLGYTTQDLYLPRSDDAGTAGIAANIYGGPGFRNNLNPAGDTLYGWRQFTPRDVYQTETSQGVERMIGALNSNWRASDWLALRGKPLEDPSCVHEARLPEPPHVDADPAWAEVMVRRDAVLKALEERRAAGGLDNPLDAGIELHVPQDVRARLLPFDPELADLCGVSRFSLIAASDERVAVTDLSDAPRCERSWKRDASVRQRSDGGWLSDRDAAALNLNP